MVLDLAGGSGRFPAALLANCKLLDDKGLPLSDIHYTFVERDPRRLSTAKLFIAENGLERRLGSVKFYTSIEEIRSKIENKNDSSSQPRFDYILVINALHEFSPQHLPYLLESLISVLVQGGHLIIQECSILPVGEKNFLPWDMECIQRLFIFQSCLEPVFAVRPVLYESRTGIPVIHTKVIKRLHDHDMAFQPDWRRHIFEHVFPKMKDNVESRMNLLEAKNLIIGHIYYTYAWRNISAHFDNLGKPKPPIPDYSPIFQMSGRRTINSQEFTRRTPYLFL